MVGSSREKGSADGPAVVEEPEILGRVGSEANVVDTDGR